MLGVEWTWTANILLRCSLRSANQYLLCLIAANSNWANIFLTIHPAILAGEVCPLEWEFSQQPSFYKQSISVHKILSQAHLRWIDDRLTEVGRQAGDQTLRSTDSESLQMIELSIKQMLRSSDWESSAKKIFSIKHLSIRTKSKSSGNITSSIIMMMKKNSGNTLSKAMLKDLLAAEWS